MTGLPERGGGPAHGSVFADDNLSAARPPAAGGAVIFTADHGSHQRKPGTHHGKKLVHMSLQSGFEAVGANLRELPAGYQ
jgi:hypothetical protein